jgi:hypothetical protein
MSIEATMTQPTSRIIGIIQMIMVYKRFFNERA